ncbi:lipoprotein [Streptomyces sp. NPDC004065]|uniref:lipoprotein n=1 Tax=Streptomyces sp. NPDC004065 TaxID=3364689 RepID=UPI00384DE5B3
MARVGAGTAWRGAGAAVALLVGGTVTGCSGSPGGDDAPAAPAAPAATATTATTAASGTPAAGATRAAARSGGRIGAPGSSCELPVAFDIAAGWKAKAVDRDAANGSPLSGELADALLRQGPVTAACEIDAKPAGNIGFLRVWTGAPGAGDARTVLRAFVAAEGAVDSETYREFTTGGLRGVEVEYRYTSELTDESKRESALAVGTPKGPVILHLGGLDDEEHEQMLPAYELARRTLRTT